MKLIIYIFILFLFIFAGIEFEENIVNDTMLMNKFSYYGTIITCFSLVITFFEIKKRKIFNKRLGTKLTILKIRKVYRTILYYKRIYPIYEIVCRTNNLNMQKFILIF